MTSRAGFQGPLLSQSCWIEFLIWSCADFHVCFQSIQTVIEVSFDSLLRCNPHLPRTVSHNGWLFCLLHELSLFVELSSPSDSAHGCNARRLGCSLSGFLSWIQCPATVVFAQAWSVCLRFIWRLLKLMGAWTSAPSETFEWIPADPFIQMLQRQLQAAARSLSVIWVQSPAFEIL